MSNLQKNHTYAIRYDATSNNQVTFRTQREALSYAAKRESEDSIAHWWLWRMQSGIWRPTTRGKSRSVELTLPRSR